MADVSVVEVRIWGKMAGAVAALRGRPGIYEFQYAPDFARTGLELSPLEMPLGANRRYSFPALNPQTYHGLPGLLADSLPDKFGNSLIDEYLVRTGTRVQDITTLQRLLYIGRRAMGALEFESADQDRASEAAVVSLQMAHLVEDARRALRGEFTKVAQSIIDVGSSAGGARAKAVIGWNPTTNEIVSGQFDLPEGFEHWILKFDVDLDGSLSYSRGFGRIEYAHYLMATACGIQMSESRLHEENGRAHFMTRRFDRDGNRKIHMHTLCGLAHLDFNTPSVHGYEQYLRAILQLNLGAPSVEQAWLRCAFNVATVNCDDHTKNLAFLMDEAGRWSLAPAYDMCFSHNPAAGKWTRQHQMLIGGKAWDIFEDDLIAMARHFDVRQPRALLDRVTDAVADWPSVARRCGVPEDKIEHIASFQPKWVQQRRKS
jgi:serine/threonine-protein kinase HipA